MNLSTRLERLETKSKRFDCVPIFLVTLTDDDRHGAHETRHLGASWTQEPGEAFEDFQERTKQAALKLGPSPGSYGSIFLIFQRTQAQQPLREAIGG